MIESQLTVVIVLLIGVTINLAWMRRLLEDLINGDDDDGEE